MKKQTFQYTVVNKNGEVEKITASVAVYDTIVKLYRLYFKMGIIQSYSIPVL